jgi:glycosyltransferase involved in cell wall biosynthesis
MLVTDVGGLPEIVPNGVCGYVTEVDPRSIAEAIDDFFSNQRYEAFSANVRKEKDRFLWPSFVKGIRDLSSRL